MDDLGDIATLEQVWAQVWLWLSTHVLAWSTAAQAVAVAAGFGVARLLAPPAGAAIDRLIERPRFPKWLAPATRTVQALAFPILWLVVLWFAVFAAEEAGWPNRLVESGVSLLTAWVVIRFASGFIRDPGWARAVAVCAWSVAALNLLGLLSPTVGVLDSMALELGGIRLSVLGVLKAAFVLALMLWLAGLASRLAESRLSGATGLSPSARVLLGKFIRVALIGVACIAALESIGIDLTALAVFGGAVGLGIGFGLQKVISNLVSGVILLMDKSVKPGDVIAIDDTFGWINQLNARYVSVITRDGTEHLIPNEDLISQQVENWSYSDTLIRLKLPIGISYDSDVNRAMDLAVDAATAVERVLRDPKPVCRLMNFGSDSVELELRVWIADPQAGVVNVRSSVLLNVWNLYHEHGIAFPYSQRDLHLKSSVPIKVQMDAVPAKKASARKAAPKKG
jgi:small-conductance mechanosensitive channel